MNSFKIYSGNDLLSLQIPQRQFIVEKLIKEKDSVIFVGDAKAGKSVLILQLICSLTSQQSFLNKYNIYKPYTVLYIQLEGELEDTQDRLRRMMKTQELNPDLFYLAYFPPLRLENTQAILDLKKDIEKICKPDVIIIDPLYACCTGSLSDDTMVRRLVGNFRIFKETLNVTLILVHHTHKLRLNPWGEPLDIGDNAFFGSTFFKAFPDHLIMFLWDRKTNIRTLSCTTQRSGEIEAEIKLKLIQPEPLYFEETTQETCEHQFLIDLLLKHKEGLSVVEILELLPKQTKVSRSTIYRALSKIQEQVQKSSYYPIKYTLIK